MTKCGSKTVQILLTNFLHDHSNHKSKNLQVIVKGVFEITMVLKAV